MTYSRNVSLIRYPNGTPRGEDFQLCETTVTDPAPGEILVRNLWMSVDPYMRGRMRPVKSYVPPFQLGESLDGRAIGQVAISRNPAYPEGALVRNNLGWREHFLSDGAGLQIIEPRAIPLQAYLGIMGAPGMTAWVGTTHIGKLKENENVFVSAAAGTVGSAVCQIAKIFGCHVVGSAGTRKKVAWLEEEAGVTALDYRACKDLTSDVAERFPNGIDLYFENVGGAHLQAAIESMNDFGRVVACGMISTYNDTVPAAGPSNLMHIVKKRIRMQGFIVRDHMDLRDAFEEQMGSWIADGKIKWRETVLESLERAPDAFIGLFKGENIGKMLVKLGDPE